MCKKKGDEDVSNSTASLSKFIKENKSTLYESARKNTKYNDNGQPTISKDEEWFDENHWDEYYKELEDKNKK